MTEDSAKGKRDIHSLDDLILDDHNANQGTERGMWSLQESLIRFGVGRGVLVDRLGQVIGGNKTIETLAKLNPDVKVVVVPSDGDTLVVTQRVDLDRETDPAARELAVADNRVAELNLAWDAQQIVQGVEDGLDLAAFFHQDEIRRLGLEADEEEDEDLDEEPDYDPVPEMEIQPFEHYDYVMVVFRNTWDWAKAVDFLGIEDRAFAFTSSKGKPHRKVGLCRVLDGARFLELLQNKCESSSPAESASTPAATS
jgi:hypothetical protein